MSDEQTNKTDTAGEEPNTTPQEDKTPSQALKEENDNLEKELIRAQKIRNETLLAGTAGGRVEPEVKEETNQEYVKRVEKAGWKDEQRG